MDEKKIAHTVKNTDVDNVCFHLFPAFPDTFHNTMV